ncbi:MAG: hypothetical protein JW801_00410 [Bacteroidales bacterium]|nr:hypothetical protein [Bacteroidales bacterium]
MSHQGNIDPINVQNICLATVTTTSYWKGTRAMIRSFLYHNPWFFGDILLITDQKAEIEIRRDREKLKAEIVEPSLELRERSERVAKHIGQYKGIASRLYILEIFRLERYKRVLFFDSDVIHLSTLDTTILFSGEIVAVRDPWYFRGYVRDKITLAKIPLNQSGETSYRDFFNSGFLSIGESHLNTKLYVELIQKVEVSRYKNHLDKILDESILNEAFHNEVSLVPVNYNCSVHLIAEGIITTPVRVLHFTGSNKPWMFPAWIRLIWRKTTYLEHLIKWNKHLHKK